MPYTMLLENSQRSSGYIFLGLALLELMSYAGYHSPALGSAVLALLTLAWIAVAYQNLALGCALLLTELVLGSLGYWYSAEVFGIQVGLRHALFAAAVAVLVWRTVVHRSWEFARSPAFIWYAVAVVGLGYAVAVGLWRGNSFAGVVLDANGYLYLLILPLFMLVPWKELWISMRYVAPIILIWLAIKTFFLLFLFTHIGAEQLVSVYTWVRNTGFGEITPAGSGFFRVFSQSHVYALCGVAASLAAIWFRMAKREQLFGWWVLLAVNAGVLIASLSRSMWLGASVALIATPAVYAAVRRQWRADRLVPYLGAFMFTLLVSSGAVLITARADWPLPALGEAGAQTFSSRFTKGEAAGESRLKLLDPLWGGIREHFVLGSGFGAEITYSSSDPRAVAASAGGTGITTTYAFEWGWLDFLYKFGLVGFALWGGFLLYVLWSLLRASLTSELAFTFAIVLIALYSTHTTTPYLNHPLGLGMVILGFVAALGEQRNQQAYAATPDRHQLGNL